MEGERICCHLGPFFALLHHNNPENQNFKKGKKHLEMSSTLVHQKHDHMMYAYSDMECDRHDFLSL